MGNEKKIQGDFFLAAYTEGPLKGGEGLFPKLFYMTFFQVCVLDAHIISTCSLRIKCHTQVVERLLTAHEIFVLFFSCVWLLLRNSSPGRNYISHTFYTRRLNSDEWKVGLCDDTTNKKFCREVLHSLSSFLQAAFEEESDREHQCSQDWSLDATWRRVPADI